jgi:hypothetical protein
MSEFKKPDGWWLTHPTLIRAAVHGFFDGNGDGLGDFRGIEEKLDYFLDMGINAYKIPHVGLYGNDYKWTGIVLQDWYKVDPHYGTMDEFDSLMKACREKNVKIVLMSVPEYIGWCHPDYLAAKEAREKGAGDPRIGWFEWKDDGTVLTCWDRPGLDTSNEHFINAFKRYISFWMDKGIAGWDADAVLSWQRLNLKTLREINEYITGRGGLVTPENMLLMSDVTKYGGFNSSPGYLVGELYNEIKAAMEHKADYIRKGLKERDTLLSLGIVPYQEIGGDSYTKLTNSWSCHIREQFMLQVAFNAALPDQVWILANMLTFSKVESKPYIIREPYSDGWGSFDWDAIREQENDPGSVFSHCRRMFRLRLQHKELAIGDIEELETNCPDDVFAALRTSEDSEERAVTVFNFSESPRNVVVVLKDPGIKRLRNYLSGEVIDVAGNALAFELNLYQYKLLKVLN